MRKNPARVILTTTAFSATLLLVAGTALSASASTASGTSGVGGGAYFGDTLVSAAWEGSVGAYTVDYGTLQHPESLDVYNYRIGVSDGATVDAQSTAGLDQLTEAEQDQWYVDAGLAPYTFDWFVFFCPAVAPGSIADPAVLATDPSINLDQVVSRTIADAVGYPALDSSQFWPWYNSTADGSVFEPDIALADFQREYSTNVQTMLLGADESPSGQRIAQATTYLDFSCPDTGNSPSIGRILKSATPDDYATERSLPIGSTIYFQQVITLTTPQSVYEIPAAGTYIAVTGANFDSNAALWGVTHVNDGARALPNTGADANAMWTATAGAVTLALAGALLVSIRRKTAR